MAKTENKSVHMIQADSQLGEVQIADEVVAIIAGLAATEVEGVASMAGNVTNELVAKLGMKKLSKGVKVLVTDQNVDVDLALNIGYGYSIMEVSEKVQDKVKAARQVTRPSATDYITRIFDGFMELHGDRQFRDDPAVVGGIAMLDGQPVTVIGIQKGTSIEECTQRNFGMASPEGYRKALRLMRQAEKFHRPIITFVNTSGAFCGMEAEELGQGEAIARNLYEMSSFKVPVICMMIGEGGSGGALALAVGNQVWMMENATYSVLSPEGFASILWKDSARAQEAAGVMKITAHDLYDLHVVEQVIPEYGGADEVTVDTISAYMKKQLKEYLSSQADKSGEDFANERYERFRRF